jgi:hypothetical protein
MLLLSLAFASSLAAEGPEDIVARCVEALGGPDAIRMYSNYQAKGDAKFTNFGREFTGTIDIIEKGKKKRVATEMAFGKERFVFVSAYDGETAFRERQGEIVDVPALNYESELKHTMQALIDGDAVFTFTKETEIDGRKVTGIEADVNGSKTTFFIDKDTYTVSELVFEDMFFGETQTKELLERRVRYDDYQDFAGVRFPARMTLYEKGEKKVAFHFTDVSFSPEVSADRFERPDQALDLRYWEEKMD